MANDLAREITLELIGAGHVRNQAFTEVSRIVESELGQRDTVEDIEAAILWRVDNPTASVFACTCEDKERYRKRVRELKAGATG